MTDTGQPEHQAIVLFDGVCNLCNGAVQFILRRDRAGYYRFASLQGRSGSALLAEHGLDGGYRSSMIVIENGRLYVKSDAALRICTHLGAAWPMLALLRIVPRPIRDFVYEFVANNRYRWFGKRESCMLPRPEHRARFLDD